MNDRAGHAFTPVGGRFYHTHRPESSTVLSNGKAFLTGLRGSPMSLRYLPVPVGVNGAIFWKKIAATGLYRPHI